MGQEPLGQVQERQICTQLADWILVKAGERRKVQGYPAV